MLRPELAILWITLAGALLTGCSSEHTASSIQPPAVTAPTPVPAPAPTPAPITAPASEPTSPGSVQAAPKQQPAEAQPPAASPAAPAAKPSAPAAKPAPPKENTVQVVAKPESITALVNKQYALPENYEPQDLVYPNVAFTFSEKIDKRKMRKEAAAALEKLFEGARQDGIALAGVSAYRSFATQRTLFNHYVKQDGEEKARTYSAMPGHSEHETGLAIDVSGSNGKCAAQNCFAATKEAAWLDEHAPEYGFIIRYPKGKEAITGYQYEPWHLRYVGAELAMEIAAKELTLEEYFNAAAVTK